MKAMTVPSYGSLDRVALTEIPEPRAGKGQVRIEVRSSGVNPADLKVVTGEVKILHGRRFPLTVGYDFAGVVDEVGEAVTDFRKGDRVFGFLAYSSSNHQGAFCEKIVAKTETIARLPDAVAWDQAGVAATAALTALKVLRPVLEGTSGRKVLINGASGGVGCFAVQIAKILGAQVTATCSAGSVEFVRKLGADEVVDYRKTPAADLAARFDLVFDVASNLSFFKSRHLLVRGGKFVGLLPSPGLIAGLLAAPFFGRKCGLIIVKPVKPDLERVASWIAEKRIVVPIDRSYPVKDLAQALRHLEKGSVRGKLAVSIAW